MKRPHVVRRNLDDPEQLAALIRSGAIWRLPMFWEHAINALDAGLVPLAECRDLPSAIAESFATDPPQRN
jgi:hypothetical protein